MAKLLPTSPLQRVIAALGLLLAVAALLAIPVSGGESSTGASAGGASSSNPAVNIKDFNFVAETITVAPGTKVTWTNSDRAAHTATADDSGFDTDKLETGQKGSVTFKKAGSFPYHCDFHAYMKGTVVVK